MQIDTRSSDFFVTNPGGDATNATISQPADLFGAPTGVGIAAGDGIIDMGQLGAMSANGLMLVPFGTTTATNTFLLNVYAWSPIAWLPSGPPGGQSGPHQWTANLLASFTCTLCTQSGVANGVVDSSHLYCGTIVLGVGNQNVSNEIISPTGNVKAHILLDTKGAKIVELRFGLNGSATACNCLARRM